jgi:hypothetical protein
MGLRCQAARSSRASFRNIQRSKTIRYRLDQQPWVVHSSAPQSSTITAQAGTPEPLSGIGGQPSGQVGRALEVEQGLDLGGVGF